MTEQEMTPNQKFIFWTLLTLALISLIAALALVLNMIQAESGPGKLSVIERTPSHKSYETRAPKRDTFMPPAQENMVEPPKTEDMEMDIP